MLSAVARRQQKTLQQDGIKVKTGLYVDRPGLLDKVIQAADEGQHVVISSPTREVHKDNIMFMLDLKWLWGFSQKRHTTM